MGEGPIRILLIEDEEDDVLLVRRSLARCEDLPFDLRVARNLAEAVARVADGSDIVLADLSLPDSDGVETVVRLHAVAAGTPIIVLTGSAIDAIALACIEAGAHDYLAKSELHALALRRALRFALERRRREEAEREELRKALEDYRGLSSDGPSATEPRGGETLQPLRERASETFTSLSQRYQALLEAYLDHLTLRERKPRLELEQLARRLGDARAGPRDLVDMHLASLEDAVRRSSGERAQTYALEGRLLALELMGHLAEYYRTGVPRPEGLTA